MRYAVLFGRRSGHRGRPSQVDASVEALRAAGHQVEVLAAADIDQAHVSCRAAVLDGVDVLLVIGGDGVVRLAANHLTGTPTALAIVPTGSGNDTARSLGIPTSARGAVQVAAAGSRRSIDLIRATGETDPQQSGGLDTYIVGSVPAALDARIAARSLSMPAALGPGRYTAAALAEIPQLRAQDYVVTCDGSQIASSAVVVTVCNMPIFGGGMRIAPDADPSDGLLDVVVIERVSALTALGLLRKVRAGTHARHPSVRIERCTSVHLQGPELTAYGDGDPLGPLPLTCTVASSALDVIVPGGQK